MNSFERINHTQLTNVWRENSLKLKSENSFTDIILIPKYFANDIRFRCHRVVLASASSYLKAKFDGNDDDAIYLGDDDQDLTADILSLLIDYMYKAEIGITLENVIVLNKYSSEYFLDDLHKVTNNFLTRNIKFDTCLKYWLHSEKFNNKTLNQKCMNFIKDKPEEFMKFSLNDLDVAKFEKTCSILKNKNCDSLLLSCIITWVGKDYGKRKDKIKDLLENIDMRELRKRDIDNLDAIDDPQLSEDGDIKDFVIQYRQN